MTQFHLTLNADQLKEELMNSDMSAVAKSSMVLVLNQIMEQERDDYLQAAAYERNGARVDYRNGYYERDYTMSFGKVTLTVPRTRNGEFSPSVFEKYARSEQAFLLAMLEMVVNGVSTRKVTKAVEELCGERVSKSFVSSLTEKLDPVVNEWAQRPLNVNAYRYVYADAMYIKVREDQKVVSKAVYIALGVNDQNKREIIGLQVNHAESKEGWFQFFQSLQARGLASPQLVISDAHEGLKQAIQQAFVGTSWQRCTVHFKRNLFEHIPKKGSEGFRSLVKELLNGSSPARARQLRTEIFDQYEGVKGYEKALEKLDEGFEDAIQFMNEPIAYHDQLRTTNNLEGINSEVRRREQVIRIFPNTQSAFRLIGALLKEHEESLDRGNRTFLKGKPTDL
ncbi:IS256 family transposase [Salicibibacter cibarius]|uniref:Mutator family transposase n=1 Tax=Salicibibacter cibarius TaxID=2743000 RepID=A0A7T7CBF0_9BACI|nr:IS256 family transposase [Salicibibacter cibarius]QQK74842.1 IS256 family transposase [Salicibibacter cibarius]QQK75914.1 IS256 family transposase [Salicibibacter cibarius]QQK75972.1 IS256 family transposase [Salicibibacter cibarius]QQK76638.1 IS256 family transposase [Salicibibacter cibarius]QQK76824.1 IS256 family transposase [Salicibibacter cibarius]